MFCLLFSFFIFTSIQLEIFIVVVVDKISVRLFDLYDFASSESVFEPLFPLSLHASKQNNDIRTKWDFHFVYRLTDWKSISIWIESKCTTRDFIAFRDWMNEQPAKWVTKKQKCRFSVYSFHLRFVCVWYKWMRNKKDHIVTLSQLEFLSWTLNSVCRSNFIVDSLCVFFFVSSFYWMCVCCALSSLRDNQRWQLQQRVGIKLKANRNATKEKRQEKKAKNKIGIFNS